MDHLRVGAWLALGGLALAALPLPAPLHAQQPTGEQALTDRLKQIQGQPEAGAAPPRQGDARAQELIEQIEAIRRDAQSEAAQSEAAQSEAADGERPPLGEDEVSTLVREGLGVEVLQIEALERDGGPVYAVTVINPPGNLNSAFLVETLLIDGVTGGLLSRVPETPRTATADPAASSQRAAPESTGLEIRRRTYR
jgi:hypothetical protein